VRIAEDDLDRLVAADHERAGERRDPARVGTFDDLEAQVAHAGRLRRAQAASRLGQLGERGTELAELLVGPCDPPRQPGDLVDLRAGPAGEPDRPPLELALQADALRLDPERAGVAVREGPFDVLEPRRRSGRQQTDALQEGNAIEGVLGHLSIIRPPHAEGMGRASYLLSQ
jgi:hypothetical protein